MKQKNPFGDKKNRAQISKNKNTIARGDFKNQKLWTLELVRGLAALAVVVCHFSLNFPEIGRSELRNAVANWGVTAVVVFFVLSGAVIRISIERSGFSFGKFMWKRILRIVPLYFLAILLTLMVEPRPFVPEKLVGHLAFAATVQGWITPTYTSNPVLWSLSYEMGFYLIFALLQQLFRKGDRVGWGLAACAGVSFFIFRDLAGPWEHLRTLLACYGVWLIGYESLRYREKIRLPVSATVLAAGCVPMISRTGITHGYPDYGSSTLIGLLLAPLLALLVSRRNPPYFEPGRQWVGPAIYAVCLALFFGGSDSRPHASLIYLATPWLVFLLTYWFRGLPKTPWLIQWATYLGFISYALYLFHYPIFFAAAKSAGADNLVGALVALLLSWIVAHFAEKQIQPQAVIWMNYLRARLGVHRFHPKEK